MWPLDSNDRTNFHVASLSSVNKYTTIAAPLSDTSSEWSSKRSNRYVVTFKNTLPKKGQFVFRAPGTQQWYGGVTFYRTNGKKQELYVDGHKVYMPGMQFEYATAPIDTVIYSPDEIVPEEKVDNDGHGKFIVGDYQSYAVSSGIPAANVPTLVEYGQICKFDGEVYNSVLKASEMPEGGINVTDGTPYYLFERNDSSVFLGPVDASRVDLSRTKFY